MENKDNNGALPLQDVEWLERKSGGGDSLEDLIDEIVVRLDDRLRPVIAQKIGRWSQEGSLVGCTEIGKYLSVMRGKKGRPLRSPLIIRMFKESGLPVCKNRRGLWWTTKNLLDRWMYERCVLQRKLYDLGYACAVGRGYKGFTPFSPIERYKPEWVAHARREIEKDRVRRSTVEG